MVELEFIGMTNIMWIMPYFHVLYFIICSINLIDIMKGGRMNEMIIILRKRSRRCSIVLEVELLEHV